MIYIGHFSFDEIGLEQEVRYGYFSMVVDTDNVEHAVNEFKELILSMKKTEDVFQRIVAVYMEDVIELQHVPKKAIVTRIQSSVGEFPKSITRSLPGVVAPGINIYGWEPDVRESETAKNTGHKEANPFIKF